MSHRPVALPARWKTFTAQVAVNHILHQHPVRLKLPASMIILWMAERSSRIPLLSSPPILRPVTITTVTLLLL
ncbi:MAG: hypothetical protein M3O31_17560 [Acidobacteriota bacterium]|nr:hypothetical protein [Acidobacteriota bacterium]